MSDTGYLLGQQRPDSALTILDAQAERMRQREAEAPRRHFEATARALPDSLFSSHPEAILAAKLVQETKQRAERMAGASKQSVARLIESLEAGVRSAESAMQTAALDDVVAGDIEMPRALAAMEHHSRAQRRLSAARQANEVLSKLPISLEAYWEAARNARSELDDLMLRLKREHLQAHPEQLQAEGIR